MSYWFENALTFIGIIFAMLVFGMTTSNGSIVESAIVAVLGVILVVYLIKNIAEEHGYNGRTSY